MPRASACLMCLCSACVKFDFTMERSQPRKRRYSSRWNSESCEGNRNERPCCGIALMHWWASTLSGHLNTANHLTWKSRSTIISRTQGLRHHIRLISSHRRLLKGILKKLKWPKLRRTAIINHLTGLPMPAGLEISNWRGGKTRRLHCFLA